MHRLVFGISGASGMRLALEVLQCYAAVEDLEIHLIISQAARNIINAETGCSESSFTALAHAVYDSQDYTSPAASGSWQCAGMIVCPCSMSSLAAISTGSGANLIHRAADVMLKERRPLILACRETPFNLIHLRNMVAVTEAGATVMPFVPAFYTGDETMGAALRQFAGRMLDQLRVENNICFRWGRPDRN